MPTVRTIDHMTRDQAAIRPDATALIFGDRRMTFAEPDRRASQAANQLRAAGIGRPGSGGMTELRCCQER